MRVSFISMDGSSEKGPWEVDLDSGRLGDAPYRCSPFQDERPEGARPELLIIHGICLPPGEFGGPWIDDLFMGALDRSQHPYFQEIASLEVSAHLVIRRDGAVTQYVPFHKRAWHAGQSCWEGREACNDFSIGIELEGADHLAYEDVQYQALIGIVRALVSAYPSLSTDQVVGHEHVAPGRKTDPGPAFDWRRLRDGLEGSLAEHAE
jgi:AmpD protein